MIIITLSPLVSAGYKIDYLICREDSWFAISEKDAKSLNQHGELNLLYGDEFDYLTEEQLYKKIPLLKGHLTIEEGKFIRIEHINGRIYVNPKHKLSFLNSSSRATNQANFNPNIWLYIKSKKNHFLKFFIFVILLLVAAYFVSWAILILVFWILFLKYYKVLAELEIYLIGTLNPAIVITEKPTRIAVFTNLSMGLGYYPLVRVVKIELPKKYRKVRQRIPVVCGYKNIENQKFWDYVYPSPIPNVTKNRKVIQQKNNEIPTQEWVSLVNWIKNNIDNFNDGYYPIRDNRNSWNEHSEPVFTSIFLKKIYPKN